MLLTLALTTIPRVLEYHRTIPAVRRVAPTRRWRRSGAARRTSGFRRVFALSRANPGAEWRQPAIPPAVSSKEKEQRHVQAQT